MTWSLREHLSKSQMKRKSSNSAIIYWAAIFSVLICILSFYLVLLIFKLRSNDIAIIPLQGLQFASKFSKSEELKLSIVKSDMPVFTFFNNNVIISSLENLILPKPEYDLLSFSENEKIDKIVTEIKKSKLGPLIEKAKNQFAVLQLQDQNVESLASNLMLLRQVASAFSKKDISINFLNLEENTYKLSQSMTFKQE